MNAPTLKRTVKQRFVASVLAVDTVQIVADVLAPHHIEIMPLKGALLQRTLYADPAERAILDVDVLVPESRFEQARELLLGAGFRLRYEAHSLMEVCFYSPNGMVLDLHQRLFTRGRYRLTTAEQFARGRIDSKLFGRRVCIQDEYDTYAHLIGLFASDHVDGSARPRLEELAFLARAFELDVEKAIERLQQAGLARATLYTLSLLVDLIDDPFAAAVLARLAQDRSGVAIAKAARFIIERARRNSPVGAVPAHLLNHSLPAAAGSLSWALLNRVRHYYRVQKLGPPIALDGSGKPARGKPSTRPPIRFGTYP